MLGKTMNPENSVNKMTSYKLDSWGKKGQLEFSFYHHFQITHLTDIKHFHGSEASSSSKF
jgi:hypothetical protein